MNFHSAQYILAGIALVFGVAGVIKPSWPLAAVAVILLAVAVLLMSK